MDESVFSTRAAIVDSRICEPRASATVDGGFRGALTRFRRAEDGSMIPLSLMLLFLMLLVGGLAVDTMRHEEKRVLLQQTLDRSVLAAASLNQTLDPRDVVADYFDKAGVSEFLTSVEVNEGLNFRQVSARATADTNPFFMHMMGVDNLDVGAGSGAEQRISNVEISLVLDVSGSMSGSRISNLKSAAKEFVSTVLGTGNEDLISISMVPYSGQVNLGRPLFSNYNVKNRLPISGVTAESYCIEVPTSTYSSASLSRTLAMPQAGFVDTWSGTTQSVSHSAADGPYYSNGVYPNMWCQPITANQVRVMGNNVSTLQSQINNLYAVGATSIDLGMKWGVTLLDPNSRGTIDNLVASGTVPSVFSGRPLEYTDPEVMKVIVLMTDGEHFAEERLNDGYRTELSDIYRSKGDGNFSIRFTSGRPSCAGSNEYWVPHLYYRYATAPCYNAWRSTPWNSGSGVVQLHWNEVWEKARMTWVAWHLYARALGSSSTSRSNIYNAMMNTFRNRVDTGEMDDRLQQVCSAAKSKGVIVFGIAFEAPTNGQTQIRRCATSDAHYYNATGLEITTAFRAIANQISHLRLTQ